jgi:hypothetical protein
MSAVRRSWTEANGGYDPDRPFGLANRKEGELELDLKRRLNDVDDELTEFRDEVTIISPVREPFDELRAYESDHTTSGLTYQIALNYVIDGYLDAIQAMFDEPELRDRLNTTVY